MQKIDPTAWDYEREYIRPYINWVSIWMRTIGFLLFSSIVTLVLWKTDLLNLKISVYIGVFFVLCIILLNIKKILILFVKVYQRYAPIKVRSMCRYEPSCSCYMIGSIEKYGAIIGTGKGIRRIYRCGHGGGGFEEP